MLKCAFVRNSIPLNPFNCIEAKRRVLFYDIYQTAVFGIETNNCMLFCSIYGTCQFTYQYIEQFTYPRKIFW